MDLNDLKQLARSASPALQQHALQIWEKEWSKQPEILFDVLRSENAETLETALNLAVVYFPEKSAGRIANLLDSSNATIRRLAVQALTPAMNKAAGEKLKQILKKEKDVFVLASAVTAAGKLGFDVATVEPYLKHQDIRLRANAVRAAAIIGRERLRELLEPRLKDASYRVQNEALKGLAQLIAETELEKLVNKRLQADDPSIRAATAYLIGELPLSRKTGFLIETLKDPEDKVIICAVRALVRVNDPIGMRAVIDFYLNCKNESLLEILARIFAPASSERLLNAAGRQIHPAEAEERTINCVLLVAMHQKNHEPFLPWILAALRNCQGKVRLMALRLIASAIDYFKHDIENLLDLTDFSSDEKAWKYLIMWKSGKYEGFEILKGMLFSGRPADVSAAVSVLRADNSLIARNCLKQAAAAGILLAMEPETLQKNLGSKPISLPEN